MNKIFIIFVIIIVSWKWYSSPGEVTLEPGVKAAEIPRQETILNSSVFEFKDYDITPLENFSIKAKVLSRKNYNFGQGSDLSPIDFALGWGKMSDESIIENINIKQSGRWYRWNANPYPIPRREIETSSANMHMIPATDQVHKRLKTVRKGDIIKLTGKLVMVTSDQGFQWRSSLTRDDTGNGACELVWVESITIVTN